MGNGAGGAATVLAVAGIVGLVACGGPANPAGASGPGSALDAGPGAAAAVTTEPGGTVEPASGSTGTQPPSPPPAVATPSVTVPPAAYRLAWADEFDGTALDLSKWDYMYPGQSDRGGDVSDPAALSVGGGLLTNTVFTDAAGIHHLGLIHTKGKYEYRYGYLEARIQFNGSPGAWCAFWLQTPTMGLVQDDPGVSGTEMDVMEHRAYDWGDVYIGAQGAANVNWNAYSGPGKYNAGRDVWAPNGVPLQNNWHTYGLLWTDTSVTWFIDREPVWQESVAVSQRTEYIVLTCEAKDQYWSGNVPAGGYGSPATSKTRMLVDYVRVWQP